MFEAPLQELVSSFAKSHADLKGRLGRIEPCGWALTIAALARQSPGPMLVLVASRSAADRLVDDLNAYLGEPTPLASPDAVREQPYGLLFPEIEMSLFDEHLADPERLQVLNDLQGGQPAIVIASLLAFLQSTAKPGSLRRRILATSGCSKPKTSFRSLLSTPSLWLQCASPARRVAWGTIFRTKPPW
jgi:hypothetical protein